MLSRRSIFRIFLGFFSSARSSSLRCERGSNPQETDVFPPTVQITMEGDLRNLSPLLIWITTTFHGCKETCIESSWIFLSYRSYRARVQEQLGLQSDGMWRTHCAFNLVWIFLHWKILIRKSLWTDSPYLWASRQQWEARCMCGFLKNVLHVYA